MSKPTPARKAAKPREVKPNIRHIHTGPTSAACPACNRKPKPREVKVRKVRAWAVADCVHGLIAGDEEGDWLFPTRWEAAERRDEQPLPREFRLVCLTGTLRLRGKR